MNCVVQVNEVPAVQGSIEGVITKLLGDVPYE